MNWLPLRSMLYRRLTGRTAGCAEVSEKSWILNAAESANAPPAIFLDHELARVTGVMEDTSLSRELGRIKGGQVVHSATVAYRVKDACLLNGSLFKGAFHRPLVRSGRKFLAKTPERLTGEHALACTYYGSVFFGHWMTDDLSLYLAAAELAVPVIADRAEYTHERDLCGVLGTSPKRCEGIHFDSLIVIDDVGQNSYKRRRYQELAARLKAGVVSKGNRLVYIKRGKQNARAARVLVNSAAVEECLVSLGFRVIDPDLLSATEIAAELKGAAVVVGVEGSHMAHAIFALADNGALCMIQPPYRFNNVFKDYTDCLGMRYGFTVGTEVEGGFNASLSDLVAIVTMLERTSE